MSRDDASPPGNESGTLPMPPVAALDRPGDDEAARGPAPPVVAGAPAVLAAVGRGATPAEAGAPASPVSSSAAVAEAGEDAGPDDEFPLDAFFVPEGSERIPVGYRAAEGAEAAVLAPDALDVREAPGVRAAADALEELVRRMREEGMAALDAALGAGGLEADVAEAVARHLSGRSR